MTQLKALGGLRLEPGSFTQPKPLVLLSYLSLEGSQPRRHLAELFWPGGKRMKSLSMTLNRLRRGAADVVEADERQARANLRSDAQALLESLDKSDWQKANELYTGAFLEGVVLEDWSNELEEWVYTTREYLAERVQYALLNLSEEAAKKQDFDKARDLAERAYKLPGLGGTEITNLKRLYPLLSASSSLLAPEVRKELDGYGITVQLSREEAKATFQGDTSTRADKIANQFPTRQTSFVGRDAELTELATRLTKVQLLTLLGPGGVGKTRLALQLAHEQQKLNAFEHVYFVALESLTSADLILPTILSTLGLTQQTKTEPLSQLIDFIGQHSILLVLDNLEHLVENVNVLSELLQKCPNLKLLVTSREHLNLEEEHLFPLEGLVFPTSNTTFEEAKTSDAVALFSQRAQQLYPQFELREHYDAVLRICKLVEGLPLGLELAASWTRLMSCNEIADEIEHNLEFLSTTTRNIPERHRSLKAALEYSWNLLTTKEQEVLRKLSVFVGGFRREAASEVAGATIPLLASLVDKSLLRVLPNGRYDRHPLLLQFMREKLAAETEEEIETKDDHARYYLRFINEQSGFLNQGQQQFVAVRLQEEWDNLRLILEQSLSNRNLEVVLEFITLLHESFEFRGAFHEGLEFLERTEALLGGKKENAELLGKLGVEKSWYYYRLGHFEKAREVSLEVLTLLPETGNETLRAKATMTLGLVSEQQGKQAEALAQFEKALDLARQGGDKTVTAFVLGNLGGARGNAGNQELAEDYFKEAIALHEKTGNFLSQLRQMGNLAITYGVRGDFDKAEVLQQKVVRLAREINFKQTLPFELSNLGVTCALKGDYASAHQLNVEALQVAEETGQRSIKVGILCNLMDISHHLGDKRAGLNYTQEAISVAQAIKSVPQQIQILHNQGKLYLQQGRFEEAATLLWFIAGYEGTDAHRKVAVETLIQNLRSNVANNALADIKKYARRLSLEQALELVLERSGPSTPTSKV